MEDIALRIHQTRTNDPSYISLEETVLIFEEKNNLIDIEKQIPIELITIFENKRFKGSRLIKAFLIPLVTILLFVLSHFALDPLKLPEESIYNNIFLIVGFSLFFLSMIVGLTYFIGFFIRAKTVIFVISPEESSEESIIEFWKPKKDFYRIDELIDQIEQRLSSIEIPLKHTAESYMPVSKHSYITEIICTLFLFSIPTLITENPYLFSLVLLPVIWFTYKGVQYVRQPKEYREAMSFYNRKDWDSSISLLKIFIEYHPEYLPAYTLLVDIYIRTKQFDDALETVADLPDEYYDLIENMYVCIWRCKRINERLEGIQS